MKKISALLILLFGISLSAHGQSTQELFAQANQLYKQGKFEKALNIYKQIPNKSAYVNYNMANCTYQLKQYGYALLYWRRAEKDWGFFNREELIDNITLLQEKLKKQHGLTGKSSNPILLTFIKLKNISISWILSMPLIILQTLFLIVWLFLFLYLSFLYKKRKKHTIITLFSLIAFFGIILAVRCSLDTRTYGVVISKNANLVSGPGKTFQQLMPLQEAQEVIIKKETENYFKIKVRRQLGWIEQKYVKKI